MMEFEWDKNKDRLNITKHGISFEQAKSIFDNVVLTNEDKRHDYGEVRKISIGELSGFVVIVIVYTKRGNKTRIISARKANKKERQSYYAHTRKKS